MMDDKLKQALDTQAAPLQMSPEQAERWRAQALSQPSGKPLRLPSRKRRLTLVVALSLCLVLLAGFGYQLISPYFEKAFTEDDSDRYRPDQYQEYEKTGEAERILATMQPGDVYQTEYEASEVTLRITIVKGNELDIISYAVKGQRGRAYRYEYYHDPSDSNYRPFWRSQPTDIAEYIAEGNFFVILDEAYVADFLEPRLYLEGGRIGRLEYSKPPYKIGDNYLNLTIRFIQGYSYASVSDMENVITEDITINGRVFTYVENAPSFGDQSLLLHLGDDQLVRNIFLEGRNGFGRLSRDELVEMAEHLIFYNEEVNRKDYPAFSLYGDPHETNDLSEALQTATLTPDHFLQFSWFPTQYLTAVEDNYYEQEFFHTAYYFTDPLSGMDAVAYCSIMDSYFGRFTTDLDALISDHGNMDVILQDAAGNYYGVYYNTYYMDDADYTLITTVKPIPDGYEHHALYLPPELLPPGEAADWFHDLR